MRTVKESRWGWGAGLGAAELRWCSVGAAVADADSWRRGGQSSVGGFRGLGELELDLELGDEAGWQPPPAAETGPG